MDVDEGFARGAEAKVPYIVGSNSLEFPGPRGGARQLPGQHAACGRRPARCKLETAYGDKTAFEQNVVSDIIFTEPARHLAALHAKNGQPTWLYRFTAMSPAIHAAPCTARRTRPERQYVFKTLKTSPWPTGGNDAAVADVMSAYWAALRQEPAIPTAAGVRTGRPMAPARPNTCWISPTTARSRGPSRIRMC